LNGKPFADLRDADPRIGPRLEVFAAGAYLWLPFVHLESVEMEAPKRLRDALWAPALVQTSAAFQQKDLGEVLLPVLYPFSWQFEDEPLWLGRSTDVFQGEDGGEIWAGQKTLLVDGEEFPFLEVRSLRFSHLAGTATEP
jgi:type VI secretion system protein ImpE